MKTNALSVSIVFILWLAGLGAAAQFAKIAVPFAAIRATFPNSGDEIGWLLSLISLLGAVFGLIVGDVVGRLGAKRVLVFGLGVGAVISLGQAGGLSFTMLVVSRLFEGASHMAIVVAAPTLISTLCPSRYTGVAMTLWSTFFGVAFAVVAWIVVPVVGADRFELVFAGHGVYMAMLTLVILFLIPRDQLNETATPRRKLEVFSVHARAYASPRIAAPGLGWLLYTFTFVSLLALLPERLPEAQTPLATGLMPIVSIITALFAVPLLLQRMSSVTVILLGFALAAVCVVANTLLNMPLIYAVGLFAILGLVQGASFCAVPELNSNSTDEALAYGLMAQTGNIGNLLGTPVLIALSSRVGHLGMDMFVVGIYLAGVGVHLVLARERRKA